MIKIALLLALINYITWFITGKKNNLITSCGLSAFYSNECSVDIDKLKLLLLYNESRGKDSTGLYIKDIGLAKVEGTASEVFLPKIKIPSENSRIIIGHNRAGTGGSKVKKNAHPFRSGSIVVAHNGAIHNVWSLCEKNGFKQTDYTVDSEIIPMLMNKLKSEGDPDYIVNTLLKLEGPQALLIVDEEIDNTLYFYRKSQENQSFERPLFRGEFMKDGMKGYYLSSLENSLNAIGCSSIREVKEDTLYTYSPEGLKYKRIIFPKKETTVNNIRNIVSSRSSTPNNGEPDYFKAISKEMTALKSITSAYNEKSYSYPMSKRTLTTQDDRWVECETCGGSGNDRLYQNVVKCPDCDGSGWIDKLDLVADDNAMDTGNEKDFRVGPELKESKIIPIYKNDITKGDLCIVTSGEYKGYTIVVDSLAINTTNRWCCHSKANVAFKLTLDGESLVKYKTHNNVTVRSLSEIARTFNISGQQISEGFVNTYPNSLYQQGLNSTDNKPKLNGLVVDIDTVSKGDILGFEAINNLYPICEVADIDKTTKTVKLRWLTEKPDKLTDVAIDKCWLYHTCNNKPITTLLDMVDAMVNYYPKETLLDELYFIILQADEQLSKLQDRLRDKDSGKVNNIDIIYDYKEELRVNLEKALKDKLKPIENYEKNKKITV